MARYDLNDGLPAVVVRDVAKTFRRPEEQRRTLKERALHPRRRMQYFEHEVLRGIDFSVDRGEFFGIVGRNGCGKSTLLKCIAGIYNCTGDIWCRGRLATFIELGVGFNMDLPAFDNVVLNGIMMGLSPKEARGRYDRVMEFAELEDFKDLKLKNYSSGMNVRLAFSTAIQVDADILLVDEVLAVGDAAFQQKCFDVFHEMREAGKTIIFVSHDMAAVQRFCHRALLLDRGEMVHLGQPREVAERYLELNFGRDPRALDGAGAHAGDGDARVTDVWIAEPDGRRLVAAPQGSPVVCNVRVRFNVAIDRPQVSVEVADDDHHVVFVASTSPEHEATGSFAADDEATFAFAFDNVLGPGRYHPKVTVSHEGTGFSVMDAFEAPSFVVSAARERRGLVDLPVSVRIDRQGDGAAPVAGSTAGPPVGR